MLEIVVKHTDFVNSKAFLKVSMLQLPGNNLKMTQLDHWLRSDENNEVIMGCQ